MAGFGTNHSLECLEVQAGLLDWKRASGHSSWPKPYSQIFPHSSSFYFLTRKTLWTRTEIPLSGLSILIGNSKKRVLFFKVEIETFWKQISLKLWVQLNSGGQISQASSSRSSFLRQDIWLIKVSVFSSRHVTVRGS